jgi:pimeloyl-ACP methyl ester carboxylesterase
MRQIQYLKKFVDCLLGLLSFSIALNTYNITSAAPINKEINNLRSTPKKVIFILNGLWRDIAIFDRTIAKLSSAFKAERLLVEVRKLPEERHMTGSKSITQQATDAFEEIKQQLAGNEYEIILIGHSQGGLRGAKILFLNEIQGKPLNIKGLITLSAPWEGVPAAAINKKLVHTFLNKSAVNYFIASRSFLYFAAIKLIDSFFVNQVFDHRYPTHELGVQDMAPNSKFLQEISASLAENSTPILAIGATSRNLERILPMSANEKKCYRCYVKRLILGCLNILYAWIFTNSWHTDHDMVVPLYSQVAQNTTKSAVFKTYIVNGAVHDILLFPSIPAEKMIYNQTEVIAYIVEFAKKEFIWSC